MAGEARLAKNIRDIAGNSQIAIYQGIVSKVDGSSCTIKFGRQEITDVRLRASLSKNDKQILIVPRKGTAVVVGSLSGDLSELVVLKVDEIESIEVNGGKLGGLINIEDLTKKLNNLVNEVNALKNKFNTHTHTVATTGTSAAQSGITAPVTSPASAASKFDKADYEDNTITH